MKPQLKFIPIRPLRPLSEWGDKAAPRVATLIWPTFLTFWIVVGLALLRYFHPIY